MARKYKKNEFDLPIPRLQIRNKYDERGNLDVEYSMINQGPSGMQEVTLTKSKFVSMGKPSDLFAKPYASFAHMLSDMWSLRIPAYIVNKEGFKQIHIKDETNLLMNWVYTKMIKDVETDPSRKPEFDVIEAVLEENRQKRKYS